MRKGRCTYICALAALALVCAPARGYCQKDGAAAAQEPVGEFSNWKAPVSRGNYYFVKSVLSVFGNRWGGEPQTEQEFEDRTWEQLVLSYEAFRRNITVEPKEVDAEVAKMLAADKVSFDRVKEPKAYEDWIKNKTRESREFFENQLRHMIQLEKLRTQVMDSFKVTVTEAEVFQKFLDEYNTLELELVQFDGLAAAQAYYAKMREPKLWDEAAKKDPKF